MEHVFSQPILLTYWSLCYREPLDYKYTLELGGPDAPESTVAGNLSDRLAPHWSCDFRAAGTLRFRLFNS